MEFTDSYNRNKLDLITDNQGISDATSSLEAVIEKRPLAAKKIKCGEEYHHYEKSSGVKVFGLVYNKKIIINYRVHVGGIRVIMDDIRIE